MTVYLSKEAGRAVNRNKTQRRKRKRASKAWLRDLRQASVMQNIKCIFTFYATWLWNDRIKFGAATSHPFLLKVYFKFYRHERPHQGLHYRTPWEVHNSKS